MKNTILVLILIVYYNSILYSQTEKVELLVVNSICEYENSYLISCVNKDLDTLYIISEKKRFNNKCDYNRIKVGEKYFFKLQKRGFPALDNFVIRIKDKVFWKTGDDLSKMPFFAKNLIDLYIIDN